MKNEIEYSDNMGKLKGHWKMEAFMGDIVKDAKGKILNTLVETIEGDNIIVSAGKALIMDRVFGLSSVGAMTRIGVGTSSTAASLTDTALTGGVFVAFDSVPTRSGLVVTCVATFGTAVANISWNEMALDNGTTLLNRIVIGPFNKSSAISIIITCQITQN